MRTALVLLCSMCFAWHAQAQGSLQFTVDLTGTQEVPQNSSVNHGSGSFTLTGDLLAWSIGCPDLSFTPTGASVHGPASASQTAAALFSLGTPTTGPGPQGGIVTFYQCSTSLLPAQIAGLEAGQWYTNILSVQYPGGEIRGQIIPVPEPSTFALVALGVGAFFLARRRKTPARNIAVLAIGLLAAASTPAQVISDDTCGGLVTVTADGGTNAGGQWIAPWVEIPRP